MRRIVFALAAFPISVIAAIAAAAAAPQASRFTYEASYFPKAEDSGGAMEFVSAQGIALDGKFSVWYLLGEPVINCTARWKNHDQASMVIDPLGDGSRFIEPAQQNEIEIYNLLLAASGPDPRDTKYGFGSAKTIAVLCDAGVVAQNGRDGFNVAGSPSWDRFLCALPDAGVRFQGPDSANEDECLAMNGKWLSAAEAKAVAVNGFKIEDVTALKAGINGGAVMKRAEKRQWREKSAAFKRERTAALVSQMRLRDGETPLDLIDRRSEADRRLPRLPQKDPSAGQLAEYEAAYRSVLADLADSDDGFTKEWRRKEKQLVGAQLERLKKLDKAAAKEEERFFDYLLALNALKKNEPKEADPMASYRTATLVIDNSGSGKCYLKKHDGTIVATGYSSRDDYCMSQPKSEYGIYQVRSLLGEGPLRTAVFDNDGNILLSTDLSHRFEFPALDYGLIGYYDFDGSSPIDYTLYSILKREVVFRGDRTYRWAELILRNGRPALQFERYPPGPWSCYYQGKPRGEHYDYFYLDTERLEETSVCIPPDEDPLNSRRS